MPSLPDTTHPPFRITEKHFKNRSDPSRFPSLHFQGIIDLSRPDDAEDDEVWQAGWWGNTDELTQSKRRKKGKEREKGERPQVEVDGLRRIELRNQREGWVVAEGELCLPIATKLGRLHSPPSIP
jgi:alkylated DNA repair protein alkB family protein 1